MMSYLQKCQNSKNVNNSLTINIRGINLLPLDGSWWDIEISLFYIFRFFCLKTYKELHKFCVNCLGVILHKLAPKDNFIWLYFFTVSYNKIYIN